VPRCLHNSDTFFNHHIQVCVIVNGPHHRKQVEIDGKRPVREIKDTRNRLCKSFTARIHGRGQDTKTPGLLTSLHGCPLLRGALFPEGDRAICAETEHVFQRGNYTYPLPLWQESH
jgi:hypothetical protein